jgi:hypothetical protein
LSATIGHALENEAYKALPKLLENDYGLVVQGRLKRGYVTDAQGNPLEINVIGQASRDGQAMMIVGESKSQLSKNEVDKFIRRKLNRLAGMANIFPLLITHMITAPDVEDYARQKGIAVYYSYDF